MGNRCLGSGYEKTNREAIRTSSFSIRNWGTNNLNSTGGIGRREIPSRFFKSNEHNKECGFSSSKQSLERAQGISGSTGRVRESDSDPSSSSSVSSQKMGKGIKGTMKTLVTANQKGGVGKTATLVHLAFDFAERGFRVVVIDLDTQANASYTLGAYKCGVSASSLLTNAKVDCSLLPSTGLVLIESDAALANMEKMTLSDAGMNFKSAISELSSVGFDICLIDTAPSLGVTMGAALFASDFVLSPIELEAYSIQGIKRMVTTISNIRKANKNLKFLGMVPSKVDKRNPRHLRHLQELTHAYPTLMTPEGIVIGLRSSIADALASRTPVWKIKKTTARVAAKEVRALAAHVLNQMEIG